MTFHIRLVSPPDLTERLVEELLADSGVSNMVVLTRSARRPDGDAVQFDVLARSANIVLRQLEAFADDRRGPITIESVDAAIGKQPTPPPRHRLVQRDIAPVWDVIEAKIRSDAVYAPSFWLHRVASSLDEIGAGRRSNGSGRTRAGPCPGTSRPCGWLSRVAGPDDDVEVLPHAEDVQRSVQGTVTGLAAGGNHGFRGYLFSIRSVPGNLRLPCMS
jgi:hypothetical protein